MIFSKMNISTWPELSKIFFPKGSLTIYKNSMEEVKNILLLT